MRQGLFARIPFYNQFRLRVRMRHGLIAENLLRMTRFHCQFLIAVVTQTTRPYRQSSKIARPYRQTLEIHHVANFHVVCRSHFSPPQMRHVKNQIVISAAMVTDKSEDPKTSDGNRNAPESFADKMKLENGTILIKRKISSCVKQTSQIKTAPRAERIKALLNQNRREIEEGRRKSRQDSAQ